MSKVQSRVNVLLAEEHAAKLHRLAEQAHVSAVTLARSLLSRALDEPDPSARNVTALLDSIDGAYERAEAGASDIQAGRVIPLDNI